MNQRQLPITRNISILKHDNQSVVAEELDVDDGDDSPEMILEDRDQKPSNQNSIKEASSSKRESNVRPIEREFTAKEVQAILKALLGEEERIGLALLNYYARTDLVPATGHSSQRGRLKYSYADVLLLCWLFRMKKEGLPVNRFRRGISYLRKRLPKLYSNPKDMLMLTDGKSLFLKHRVDEKEDIAEVLTGPRTGQYVWAYAIGSLIEELDRLIDSQTRQAA